ncbi:MAG: DHH family phosphoesterase [Synergistaceae bacterium]|nr:DHH family phosphoesterase [Synergistaceae bacterium]
MCSAIAYANLKRKLGVNCETRIASPVSQCGNALGLKYFDVPVPPVLDSAAGENIILVDHNLFSQAAAEMDKADILEVIDHHNIGGDVKTGAPIYYRAMPVGCTSTIVWLSYLESNVEIDKQNAGLMLTAILSDTVNLHSQTTTELDRQAVKSLEKIVGFADEEARTKYFRAMKEALVSYAGMTEREIITSDYKEYNKSGVKFAIGIVESLTPEKQTALAARLDKWAKDNYKTLNVNMVFILVQDLETMTYKVAAYGDGADEVALNVFGKPNAVKTGKFITVPYQSRKKLIAPIEKAIQDWLNSQLDVAA